MDSQSRKWLKTASTLTLVNMQCPWLVFTYCQFLLFNICNFNTIFLLALWTHRSPHYLTWPLPKAIILHQILLWLAVFWMNCLYWQPQYPHLISFSNYNVYTNINIHLTWFLACKEYSTLSDMWVHLHHFLFLFIRMDHIAFCCYYIYVFLSIFPMKFYILSREQLY